MKKAVSKGPEQREKWGDDVNMQITKTASGLLLLVEWGDYRIKVHPYGLERYIPVLCSPAIEKSQNPITHFCSKQKWVMGLLLIVSFISAWLVNGRNL